MRCWSAGGTRLPLSGSTTATPAPVHATGLQPPVLAHAGRAPAPTTVVRRPAGPARSRSPPRRPSTTPTRAASPPGSTSPTGWTGSDSRCRRGRHLGGLAGRHPARGELRARDERPRAGHVLRRPERPLAAHRADDVGQRAAEPRAAAQLALLVAASGAANAGRSNLALSYPSITSAGLVELYMREPGSRQRRRRPPALAAEPVRHHDGHRVHRHRQRHDRHRSHRGGPAQPGLGLVADAPATSRTPWSRAAAGRSRPATGGSTSAARPCGSTATARPSARPSCGCTTAMPSRPWSGSCRQARRSSGTFKVVVRGAHLRGLAQELRSHLRRADVRRRRADAVSVSPKANARVGCQPDAASWRYIHISFTSKAASNRSSSTNACSSGPRAGGGRS